MPLIKYKTNSFKLGKHTVTNRIKTITLNSTDPENQDFEVFSYLEKSNDLRKPKFLILNNRTNQK